MTAANDNKMNDTAFFCSACGSADITTPALAGGEACCNVCGWKGRVEELAAFPFSHDLGSTQEVFRLFFLDLRKLLSLDFARSLGGLLIKWGFLEQPSPKNIKQAQQHLARYIAGAAKAIGVSVVQTRAELEKEKYSEQPSA